MVIAGCGCAAPVALVLVGIAAIVGGLMLVLNPLLWKRSHGRDAAHDTPKNHPNGYPHGEP